MYDLYVIVFLNSIRLLLQEDMWSIEYEYVSSSISLIDIASGKIPSSFYTQGDTVERTKQNSISYLRCDSLPWILFETYLFSY